MTIEQYLKQFKIKKSEFGQALGYATKQGIYTALKNERQRPLLHAFLLVMILRKKGVNLEKLIDSLK